MHLAYIVANLAPASGAYYDIVRVSVSIFYIRLYRDGYSHLLCPRDYL